MKGTPLTPTLPTRQTDPARRYRAALPDNGATKGQHLSGLPPTM